MDKLMKSVKNLLEFDYHDELRQNLRKLVYKYGEDEYLKDSIHLYRGLEKVLEGK